MMNRVYTITIALILLLTAQSKSQEFELSDQFFVPGLDLNITHAEVINGELYIGGDFDWYNGEVNLNSVAKWNGDSWQPIGTGFGGGLSYINDFEWFEGELYAAGYFSENGEGEEAHSVAKYNGTVWVEVGQGLNRHNNSISGNVYDLIVFNGELYAGGKFDKSGGVDLKNIAKWDGESWQPDGFFNDIINSFEIVNDQLVAVGTFDAYIDSSNNSLPQDLFIGEYLLTQLNVSKAVSGTLANGYLFDGNGNPVTINISDEVTNPFTSGTPREFELDYLPQFGGFSFDMTVSFNEDSTVTIPRIDHAVGCGIGIQFGTVEDSFGSYDPSDDSEFTFALIENTLLDCGAPADTVRFKAERNSAMLKSSLQTINHFAVRTNSGWKSTNYLGEILLQDASVVFENQLIVFGSFVLNESDTVEAITWNGELWQEFEEDYSLERVYTAEEISGELFISGKAERNHFKDEAIFAQKWDGQEWISYKDTLGSFSASNILKFNDELVLSGLISDYHTGNIIRSIVRWSGTSFVAFDNPKEGISFGDSGTRNGANTLAELSNGTIVVGGRFLGVSDTAYAALAFIEGNMMKSIRDKTTWNVDGMVTKILDFENSVFLSSSYSPLTIFDEQHITPIIWNTVVDQLLHTEDAVELAETNRVSDMAIWEGRPIIVGHIEDPRSSLDYNFAILIDGGNSWVGIGSGFDNNVTNVLVTETEELYVSGNFTESKGVENLGIARYDKPNATWVPLTATMTSEFQFFEVEDMVEFNGDIIFVGEFNLNSTYSTTMRFDGSSFSQFDYENNTLKTLEVHNGNLYAAGLSQDNNSYIFKWDEESSSWEKLAQLKLRNLKRGNAIVNDLLSTEEGLYFAGYFDLVNGIPMNDIGIMKTKSVSNEFESIVSTYKLHQNYPNPFNPNTMISFNLPEPGVVKLEVFDIMGRKVAELADQHLNEGSHSYNFDASTLSSGTYIYRLKANGQVLTKKMMLIK